MDRASSVAGDRVLIAVFSSFDEVEDLDDDFSGFATHVLCPFSSPSHTKCISKRRVDVAEVVFHR